MVGKHRVGRRPQRDVHARGPADPPLQPRAGRRHRRRVERLQQRRGSVQGAEGRGLRRVRPYRRPLRRHQDGARRQDRARRRSPFRLGHVRVAGPGRAGAGLSHRHPGQFRRSQGPPWREPSRRLDVRRLRRPVVPSLHGADACRPVRCAAPASSLCDHRLPHGARDARNFRERRDTSTATIPMSGRRPMSRRATR